ncbi:MAG TPA: type III PLP-dependent enzyme [Candidatus Tectomicrobia bacterium]|nr:type III PLP-dependent enzyme [Candidatus Tectomicrobia bacterium]
MNSTLVDIAQRFGTPCYVYFMEDIAARCQALRQAFARRFMISYAVKANPNVGLLRRFHAHTDALDISSAGEMRRALRAGWSPQRLSFTGPGKRSQELVAAVTQGIGHIVVESVHEARTVSQIAREGRTHQDILVRLAPRRIPRGFGLNMAGKPSQFGIDEEDLDAAFAELKTLPNLRIRGFHIYSGTQCLDANALVEHFEGCCELFRQCATRHAIAPSVLVFGSGFGIPYHPGQEAFDLGHLAARVNPALDALLQDDRFHDAVCVLETGRYLVGEAGIFVTRVLRVKASRGTRIAICDGGMHHHLAACGHLGSVIRRNYRLFKVNAGADTGETATYELVGPLCTSIDTLGHAVELPTLDEGDLIGIHCSGAYGLTVSPMHFISHPPPKEILVGNAQGQPSVEDISQFTAGAC